MQPMSATSSSSEKAEQPLYIWPKDADLSHLKSVVLELNLPFRVRPFWYEPGKHDRVIAMKPGFSHIADHVYPKTRDTAKVAVQWALGLIDLPQAHTIEKKMERIFGEGTREVFDESPWTNKPVLQDGKYVWP